MREPLPGWGISYTKFAEMDAGILLLSVDTQEPNRHLPRESQRAARWWIEYEGSESEAWSTLDSAQLAAEDAARALATDIVAALGGSVTWPGEVATTSHAVWRILCGGCQAVVRVTGRLGTLDCPSCRQPIISRGAPDA